MRKTLSCLITLAIFGLSFVACATDIPKLSALPGVEAQFNSPERSKPPVVLFILSSDRHGYWGEELAMPVEVLKKGGISAKFASPTGQAIIDPASAPDPDVLPPDNPLFQWTSVATARIVKRLHESIANHGTLELSRVRGYDYDAVVVVGGHGAMFDINRNREVHRILREAYYAEKIVAAECHGTGALAFARDRHGNSLIRGRRVTGFPDVWEPENLRPELPYILQDVLNKASGGRYESGLIQGQPPSPFVIVQGRIITSRDPMSSEAIGITLLQALIGK